LSGFARPRSDSEESALKYFLIGAFSSAIMVFGIALVYGGTGTTQIHEIAAAVRTPVYNPALFAAGAGLVLVGLGFKVGAVPFHMWTPDVTGAHLGHGVMAVGPRRAVWRRCRIL
jgi:NADH-quinone oxidoreductase subunit N